MNEVPTAYTWDPDLQEFFDKFDLEVKRKDIYTSVHFVVCDGSNPDIKCEIQVRTLSDEIWGEIDHYLNYPYPTENLHCKEQLRVLARLSTAGTRLVDSIINSSRE